MTRAKRFVAPLCFLLTLAIAASPALAAAADTQSDLYRAYFLEHERGEYAQAKKLYDQALRSESGGDVGRAAKAGSGRCRDQLAARNFAQLMPPDALAYVEFNRPGEVCEKLAEMLGLTGKSIAEVLAQRPSADSSTMVHIPSEITISPALFNHIASFGGLAVALTDFDPHETRPPSGVLVIHHGDTDLLRGLLETAFQFSPTAEKIKGMATFGIQVPELGRITGVLTESLLIVGTGRDLVEGVVDRLTGSGAPSLASRKDLADAISPHEGGTLFGYVDLQGMIKVAKSTLGDDENARRQFAIANVMADLDNLRWATFSMGIDDGSIGARLAVRYAENHHSIVYNLMRLPPMSRQCLRNVPPNAAAFFGIGLNPALAQAAANAAGAKASDDAAVTGFDIPRELFGNIREICAFVIPGKMSKPAGPGGPDFIPNVGILLAANDVSKSGAVWGQMLAIPGLVAGENPAEPKRTKIGSTPVTVYTLPEIGKVYVAEVDHCLAIGLTRSALKATLRAHNKKKSILDDELMGKIIAGMPADSSIMWAANVGRLAEVAAGTGDAGVAMIARQAAELCGNMVAWFGLGQSPNQLTIEGALTGLPDLNKALKKFGPMLQAAAGMALRQQVTRKEPALAKAEKETRVGFDELNRDLHAAHGGEDYEKALTIGLKMHDLRPDDVGTQYNIACLYCLLGKRDKAYTWLEKAIAAGYRDADHLRSDDDFKTIHDEDRFGALVKRAAAGMALRREVAIIEPKPARVKKVAPGGL